ncbi:TraR/DksA C4-type zinc finger protein [Desulfocurvus sp.]|uniref:TraR/DksA family transcriptional regulator n=1 Tax=Desulfocurvus sp. TaxID=2871698 RepID=UPI0025C68FF6|nr:TraR/DksA C4-type zinc finger protein [Desulfocurvus sp.]MCK9240490.1 TraR/DksA C4-type zinc finger protein [Desulfocurvus sp.]
MSAPGRPREPRGTAPGLDYAQVERTLRAMLGEIDAKGRATVAEETAAEDRFADVVDLAQAESNRSMALRLRDREFRMVRKIHQALKRLEDGTYGICEDCGEPIAPARLLARPVTTLCADCKAEREADEALRS